MKELLPMDTLKIDNPETGSLQKVDIKSVIMYVSLLLFPGQIDEVKHDDLQLARKTWEHGVISST